MKVEPRPCQQRPCTGLMRVSAGECERKAACLASPRGRTDGCCDPSPLYFASHPLGPGIALLIPQLAFAWKVERIEWKELKWVDAL